MEKIHRLTEKEEFEKVFRGGRFIRGATISFKVRKTNLGHVRVGIIVGQKISKKANIRNKVKRQIKEIVREYVVNSKLGIDIVIVPIPEIVNKKFSEIKKDIDWLFNKIDVK